MRKLRKGRREEKSGTFALGVTGNWELMAAMWTNLSASQSVQERLRASTELSQVARIPKEGNRTIRRRSTIQSGTVEVP